MKFITNFIIPSKDWLIIQTDEWRRTKRQGKFGMTKRLRFQRSIMQTSLQKNTSFLKPKSITHNFVDKTTEQKDKKVKEGWIHCLCLNWDIFTSLWTLVLLFLRLSDPDQDLTPSAPKPSDIDWIIPRFPGSLACRGQIVGLLGLHNYVSQFL